MTASRVDPPSSWDDVRDTAFFRVTAHLFSPRFCLGATVLLASYDDAVPAVPALSSPTVRPAGIAAREARLAAPRQR